MVTTTMATLFVLNAREVPVAGVVATEAGAAMVAVGMAAAAVGTEDIQEEEEEEDTEVVVAMTEDQVVVEAALSRADDPITE